MAPVALRDAPPDHFSPPLPLPVATIGCCVSSPEAKYAAHGAAEPSLKPEPAPATGGDDVAEAAAAREPSARESEADSQALHLWKSALQEIHLTTLLKDCLSRKVVTLSHTATLAEALRALAEANILSAPVIISADASASRPLLADENAAENGADSEPAAGKTDAQTGITKSDTLMGFFDVAEVLSAFIAAASTALRAAPPDFESRRDALARVGLELASRPVLGFVGDDAEVLHKANVNMNLKEVILQGFLALGPARSSLDGMSTADFAGDYSAGRSTVHRLAVFALGRIVAVMSQSDVIRHLYLHAQLKPGLGRLMAQVTVEQAGLCRGRSVVAVPGVTPAHAAFATMYSSRVSAVGIMSADAQLVSTLSASDLKRILPEQFGLLALPVLDFLREIGQQGAGARAGGAPPAPRLLTCEPQTALLEVVRLLATTGRHRVYVLGPGGKWPLAVVTATDILRWTCTH